MVGRGEEVAISVVTHIHIFNITGSSDHVLEDVCRIVRREGERKIRREGGKRDQ